MNAAAEIRIFPLHGATRRLIKHPCNFCDAGSNLEEFPSPKNGMFLFRKRQGPEIEMPAKGNKPSWIIPAFRCHTCMHRSGKGQKISHYYIIDSMFGYTKIDVPEMRYDRKHFRQSFTDRNSTRRSLYEA